MSRTPEPVTPSEFVAAMNHFTSGVAIVTSRDAQGPVGATAAAIAPIASDPPTVMVSLSSTSGTAAAILGARTFAINVLDEDAAALAGRFATRAVDKFENLAVESDVLGNTVLPHSVAVLSCRLVDAIDAGSHREIRAQVVDVDVRGGNPLAYYRGSFAHLRTEADAALLQAIRMHVLSLRTDEVQLLDPDALAEQFATPRGAVLRALSSLRAETLVERREGTYYVASVSEDLVDRTYEAKLAIEMGVAAQIIDRVTDDQVEGLRERLRGLRHLAPGGDAENIDDYVAGLNDLCEAFVGLAGSQPLLHAYHALGLPGIDRRTITRAIFAHIPPGGGFEAVVDGLAARDLQSVLDALRSDRRKPAYVRNAGRATPADAAESDLARVGWEHG